MWAPHHRKPRPRRRQSGGIALHGGSTRRRHAARRLRVVQNPHRHQPEVRRVASKTGAGPLGAKKFAQHHPSRGSSAKKLAQQAQKHQIWANLSAQGELFRAFTIYQRRRENFFARADVVPPVHYPSATRPHWYGGCQRGRRAREDSRRRAKSHISDPAQLVWRTSEGPEGPAVAPVDNGARPRCLWTAAGKPRQISHVISLGHFLRPPENVAIPTVRIQCLK